MLKYCTRCVMPSTRPHMPFDDEGVCSACRNAEKRHGIDWAARERELVEVLGRYRSTDGYYDCVVPVSGGKDSTFQVQKVLEYGMTPLAVTATTCDLSDVGRRNLENVKSLGVDLFEVGANTEVRKKINRIALTQVGDISWPEHVSIFTFPIWIAIRMNIPLIIWGENSLAEYGGPAAEAEKNVLDAAWLQEFGGMLGLRPSDLIGVEGIRERDLILYNYPSDELLQQVGVTGLYLGYYLPWDAVRSMIYSQAYGFEAFAGRVENQFTNYENLDNYQAGIHDYFCYLKYGFGRALHQACILIRNGTLTRKEAVPIVNRVDGKYPSSYLGKSLEDILAHIDMSVEEFDKICDDFTNKSIFMTNNQGTPIRDRGGNLIKRPEFVLK